jgi:hypothetical protein
MRTMAKIPTKRPVLPTPDERPVCSVPECSRPVIMRDRTGLRIRWRTHCYWHHRRGVTVTPPKRKERLTDGLHCATKKCPFAPEAFSRPDGRVYIRTLCRSCRRRFGSVVVPKVPRSPKQPVYANAPPMPPLLGKHRRWKDTPLAQQYRSSTAMVPGGIWVKDDDQAWFVPDRQVRLILQRDQSTFDLARNCGLPSRVVMTLQSEASRGRLRSS